MRIVRKAEITKQQSKNFFLLGWEGYGVYDVKHSGKGEGLWMPARDAVVLDGPEYQGRGSSFAA